LTFRFRYGLSGTGDRSCRGGIRVSLSESGVL
jgi:hypothetical protein